MAALGIVIAKAARMEHRRVPGFPMCGDFGETRQRYAFDSSALGGRHGRQPAFLRERPRALIFFAASKLQTHVLVYSRTDGQRAIRSECASASLTRGRLGHVVTSVKDILSHDDLSSPSEDGTMPKADKPPAAVALVEARKAKGLAQDAVARLIGVPRDTYAKWEKRGTPRAFLARAAHALDATIEALASGDAAGFFPPKRSCKERIATKSDPIEIGGEQYTALPVYDVRAAAGAGALNHHEEVERHHLFHSQWLRSITTAPAGMLAVIQVSGDSMENTLHNGDHVLIDRTQAAFRRDGIYALDIGDGLQVKRVAMHPINNLLTIKSDNPAYPAWEGIKPDGVCFVGRVIWLGRQV